MMPAFPTLEAQGITTLWITQYYQIIMYVRRLCTLFD